MKRLFGFLILAAFFSMLHAQRVLSLDSCRNMAIANNKSLLIAKERMRKAHYDRKAAFTNFLPDFSATGTYMYFSDEISLLNDGQKSALNHMGTSLQQGLTQAATPIIQHIAQTNPQLAASLQQAIQSGKLDGMSTALNQLGNELTDALRTDTRNMWAGAVTLMQPLYMGGKIRAYHRITKFSEALARTQHDAQLQDLILNTDDAYWTVVSLSYKKKMAESFLDLVNRLDGDVEKMIREGVATKADGLTVKVKVNEAEMLLTKVDNGLALSKMVLCQLCGMDLDTKFTLTDENRELASAETSSLASAERERFVQILCKMLTMSEMEDKKLGRYERQTMLPEIRTGGQERLRAARVLVVGTGGLGSPVSLYLAGAGIGHIGLVDDDTVSTTNLHRQVLYAEAEVGLPKVVLAARRLRALNSDVDVKPYACRLTPDNAAGMIQDYDIVVDACDNYPTRYLLNDICRAQGKPYVYGAIEGFCGQVSVFCRTAEAKSYRDLYPDEEGACQLPPAFKGVVGMTPAIVGSVQAHEVMKLVCGYGDVLDGRLWTIDLRTMQSYIIEL